MGKEVAEQYIENDAIYVNKNTLYKANPEYCIVKRYRFASWHPDTFHPYLFLLITLLELADFTESFPNLNTLCFVK